MVELKVVELEEQLGTVVVSEVVVDVSFELVVELDEDIVDPLGKLVLLGVPIVAT